MLVLRNSPLELAEAKAVEHDVLAILKQFLEHIRHTSATEPDRPRGHQGSFSYGGSDVEGEGSSLPTLIASNFRWAQALA